MTLSTGEHRKIRKALADAWADPAGFTESPTWQADTMRRIRRSGSPDGQPGYFQQLGQSIWRLAPVVCLLIIALTAVVIQTDFVPEDAVLSVFDNDMEALILNQVVGS